MVVVMRDYHRKDVEMERPRLNLVRGIDGRLRRADTEDTTDIWVDQEQVRDAGPAVQKEPQPIVPDGSSPGSHWLSSDFDQDDQERPEPGAKRFRLPQISLPHLRLAKKHVITGVALVVVIVVSASSFNLIGGKPDNTIAQEPKQQTSTDVLHATDAKDPSFTAVLPAGKSIDDLGGWARVSPLEKDPVFAYTDTVDGVQLNVSQQQLPESLRTNTVQEVAKLAEGFAANEKIVAGDTTAYLGTSIRGPQSVIFVKQDLLILIKSSTKLTNERWIEYIGSLR